MIPGIVSATPIVEGQVMATAADQSYGALVRGLRSEDMRKYPTIYSSLTPGAMNGFDDGTSVILGSRLADKLGLRIGDPITLLAPKGAITPFGATPRVKTYRIAAPFRVGMSEYDQTFVFMALKEAQLFFGLGDSVAGSRSWSPIPTTWRGCDAGGECSGPPLHRVRLAASEFPRCSARLQVERNTMFLIPHQ